MSFILSGKFIVKYNFIHTVYSYNCSIFFTCTIMSCTITQIEFNVSTHHIHNIRVYGMSSSYETPILFSGANIHSCATCRSQLGEEYHSTPVYITAAFSSEATVTFCGKYRIGREHLTMRVIDSMKGTVVSVHYLCEGKQSSHGCVIFTAGHCRLALLYGIVVRVTVIIMVPLFLKVSPLLF